VFGSQPHPADQIIAAAARVSRWNWAAGSVVGLAILCLVFAVPRFAVAVDSSQMSQQQLGDWLLYGSALGSLLTVICLASRRVAVVATLSVVTAAIAIVAVFKLQGDWNLSHNTTWASLGLVLGLGTLGLCSSLGLRRTN
jgi:pheromone shutdown protein TraB